MKRVKVAAVSLLLIPALAGCSPREGDPCSHRGDVYAVHGNTMTCHRDKDGSLHWRK